MIHWNERPKEVASLLNPAFCGEIILECISSHNDFVDGFPFPMVFLILPIVLHPKTRDTIPYQTKHMHMWIQAHKEVLIGFPERARNMVPITMETLIFLLQLNCIKIDRHEKLTLNKEQTLKKIEGRTTDINDYIRVAKILGKLFTHSGNTSTIFTMLGVRP